MREMGTEAQGAGSNPPRSEGEVGGTGPLAVPLALVISVETTPSGSTSMAISGEVDGSNLAQLEATLAEVGEGPIRLDLGALDFIDIAGITLLVDAARRRGETPGMELVEAPRVMVQAMALLGWDRDPCLVVLSSRL